MEDELIYWIVPVERSNSIFVTRTIGRMFTLDFTEEESRDLYAYYARTDNFSILAIGNRRRFEYRVEIPQPDITGQIFKEAVDMVVGRVNAIFLYPTIKGLDTPIDSIWWLLDRLEGLTPAPVAWNGKWKERFEEYVKNTMALRIQDWWKTNKYSPFNRVGKENITKMLMDFESIMPP